MLRPATPLSILLFVAFALLVISVISTPIVKGIKLAEYKGVDFGVLGYCQGSQCSGPEIGYSARAFSGGSSGDFSLPSNTRHSLSSLLVVHPIAAFLTLILFILSVTAHFHSPSHSPRYLLALLILTLPTLILTLLAFLIDILLFIPHLAFGGWLVLAATILIAAGGIVTCAMRRTLVSRRARKKRIEENAEMNGDNFYKTQSPPAPAAPPPMDMQPTAPMVNGSPGADKLPQFATFDLAQKDGRRTSNEERMPLNQASPSERNPPASAIGFGSDRPRDMPPPRSGSAPPNRSRANTAGRDEFGNPLPPSSVFGPGPGVRREHSDPRLRHQYSAGAVSSRSGPSPHNGRGRGGFAPPRGYGYGRGGGPGGYRGPPPMGPPQRGYDFDNRRGGPGGPGMGWGGRGGQRGPPGGYGNGYGPGPGPEQPPYGPGYNRRPSPGPPSAPGYGRRPSPGPPSAPGYGRGPSPPEIAAYSGAPRQQSPHGPDNDSVIPRAESPPPLPNEPRQGQAVMFGQAVEMDATTGSPSPSLAPPQGFTQFRDSDGNAQDGPLRQGSTAMTTSSIYSNAEYVPARQNWKSGKRPGTPPLNAIDTSRPQGQAGGPAELPTVHQSPPNANVAPSHARIGSNETYYEDVDPKFAEPQPRPLQPTASGALPANLRPGGYDNDNLKPSRDNSYEDMRNYSRSPAESDTSHYTSVSERGINPQWNPSGVGAGPAPRRQSPGRMDMNYSGNDYQYYNGPGPGPGPGHGRPRGGSRGPRQPGPIPPFDGTPGPTGFPNAF